MELNQDSFACNHCLCPLRKFRYKCIFCIDYDVCGECLMSAHTHHPEDHAFLKLSTDVCDKSISSSHMGRPEEDKLTVADELSVLDSMQLLTLDSLLIAQQCRMPVKKVDHIMQNMFDNYARECQRDYEECCPGLEVDLLCYSEEEDDFDDRGAMHSERSKKHVSVSMAHRPTALTLWEPLVAIADHDDVAAARGIWALEEWFAIKDISMNFNLCSLMRITQIAERNVREPLLLRRLVTMTTAVVQSAQKRIVEKRKSLFVALKVGSRTRTKKCLDDITSYAVKNHFTPAPPPTEAPSTTGTHMDDSPAGKTRNDVYASVEEGADLDDNDVDSDNDPDQEDDDDEGNDDVSVVDNDDNHMSSMDACMQAVPPNLVLLRPIVEITDFILSSCYRGDIPAGLFATADLQRTKAIPTAVDTKSLLVKRQRTNPLPTSTYLATAARPATVASNIHSSTRGSSTASSCHESLPEAKRKRSRPRKAPIVDVPTASAGVASRVATDVALVADQRSHGDCSSHSKRRRLRVSTEAAAPAPQAVASDAAKRRSTRSVVHEGKKTAAAANHLVHSTPINASADVDVLGLNASLNASRDSCDATIKSKVCAPMRNEIEGAHHVLSVHATVAVDDVVFTAPRPHLPTICGSDAAHHFAVNAAINSNTSSIKTSSFLSRGTEPVEEECNDASSACVANSDAHSSIWDASAVAAVSGKAPELSVPITKYHPIRFLYPTNEWAINQQAQSTSSTFQMPHDYVPANNIGSRRLERQHANLRLQWNDALASRARTLAAISGDGTSNAASTNGNSPAVTSSCSSAVTGDSCVSLLAAASPRSGASAATVCADCGAVDATATGSNTSTRSGTASDKVDGTTPCPLLPVTAKRCHSHQMNLHDDDGDGDIHSDSIPRAYMETTTQQQQHLSLVVYTPVIVDTSNSSSAPMGILTMRDKAGTAAPPAAATAATLSLHDTASLQIDQNSRISVAIPAVAAWLQLDLVSYYRWLDGFCCIIPLPQVSDTIASTEMIDLQKQVQNKEDKSKAMIVWTGTQTSLWSFLLVGLQTSLPPQPSLSPPQKHPNRCDISRCSHDSDGCVIEMTTPRTAVMGNELLLGNPPSDAAPLPNSYSNSHGSSSSSSSDDDSYLRNDRYDGWDFDASSPCDGAPSSSSSSSSTCTVPMNCTASSTVSAIADSVDDSSERFFDCALEDEQVTLDLPSLFNCCSAAKKEEGPVSATLRVNHCCDIDPATSVTVAALDKCSSVATSAATAATPTATTTSSASSTVSNVIVEQGKAIPPSILKKRSAYVSSQRAFNRDAADDEVSKQQRELRKDGEQEEYLQPANKKQRVRFSDEIPSESPPCRGVYLRMKQRRAARRHQRNKQQLLQVFSDLPEGTTTSTSQLPSSTTFAADNTFESYTSTGSSQGETYTPTPVIHSYWSDFRYSTPGSSSSYTVTLPDSLSPTVTSRDEDAFEQRHSSSFTDSRSTRDGELQEPTAAATAALTASGFSQTKSSVGLLSTTISMHETSTLIDHGASEADIGNSSSVMEIADDSSFLLEPDALLALPSPHHQPSTEIYQQHQQREDCSHNKDDEECSSVTAAAGRTSVAAKGTIEENAGATGCKSHEKVLSDVRTEINHNSGTYEDKDIASSCEIEGTDFYVTTVTATPAHALPTCNFPSSKEVSLSSSSSSSDMEDCTGSAITASSLALPPIDGSIEIHQQHAPCGEINASSLANDDELEPCSLSSMFDEFIDQAAQQPPPSSPRSCIPSPTSSSDRKNEASPPNTASPESDLHSDFFSLFEDSVMTSPPPTTTTTITTTATTAVASSASSYDDDSSGSTVSFAGSPNSSSMMKNADLDGLWEDLTG